MDNGQLGNWHARGGTNRVGVVPACGVRPSVHPATRTPQKGRGGGCTLHCRKVGPSFLTYLALGRGETSSDAATRQPNTGSSRTRHRIGSHSSMAMVQSEI